MKIEIFSQRLTNLFNLPIIANILTLKLCDISSLRLYASSAVMIITLAPLFNNIEIFLYPIFTLAIRLAII
jgi:hypothetical protein